MSALALMALALVPTAAPDVPRDLALVPGRAVGFVHVRLADIYQSPVMSDLRSLIAKAGPTALRNLEKRFPAPLSDLDRVTVIFVASPDGNLLATPNPVVVVAMRSPLDRAKLTPYFVPGGAKLQVGGREVTARLDSGQAIWFADDRTAVIGYAASMGPLFAALADGDGPMKAHAAAAASRPMTAVFDATTVPESLLANVPPAYLPALKARSVTATMDFGKEMVFNVAIQYADAAAATAAEKAARDGIAAARTLLGLGQFQLNMQINAPPNKELDGVTDMVQRLSFLAGTGMIQQYSEWLGNMPIRRVGDRLMVKQTVSFGDPSVTILISLGVVATMTGSESQVFQPVGNPPSR